MSFIQNKWLSEQHITLKALEVKRQMDKTPHSPSTLRNNCAGPRNRKDLHNMKL